MAGISIGRIAATATLGLTVAAVTIGIAQADVGSARDSLAAGNYSDAITDLDQVLQKAPKNEEAHFLKGLAFARSGDIDGALKVFNTLVEDQPDMAEAWNNLGVLRARDDDLTGARDALLQATRIDPQHGPAQENLGDIYVALARNAYSRAGELESDNALARAKSQQLAAFIGSGQGSDQGSDQGNAEGNAQSAAQTTSSDSANGASTPAPNVTRRAEGQAVIDTSTPQTALQSWSRAWSAQDVSTYLAMYSDAFVPDHGASRSAWAAQRRERVSAPSSIDVTISDVQVTRKGEQALVRFNQRYRSSTYQDQEHKALLMGEGADGWQILREGSADDVDFTVAAKPQASAPAAASMGESGQSSTPPSTLAAGKRSAPAEMPAASEVASQAASQVQAARQAVQDALQGWAAAWSNQNMQAYMNAYSDNYRPREGESRIDWVRERKSALKSPGWVSIDLSDVHVSLLGGDRAQASFNQHYHSDRYEDRERKRVTLVHEDGGWRIVRES